MRDTATVALALGLGWAATGIYIRLARRRNWLAPVTPRSMHRQPVPVGGGVAVVALVLALWGWRTWPPTLAISTVLMGAVGLAALSWLDDLRPVPVLLRLAAHAAAVAAVLAGLAWSGSWSPGLPVLAVVGLAWLWFVNAFNFMDGIDGLATVEAIAVAAGAAAVLAVQDGAAPALALVIVGAAAGFLIWNWQPARVFLGDAGSIPLGFLLGWLLLDLVRRGLVAAAIILPLYFLADATLTLLRRLVRGAPVWRAHRAHAYQRAVLGGTTMAAVVGRVACANVVLCSLAVWSISQPMLALLAACAVVALLLAWLERAARRHALPGGESNAA